MNDKIQLMPGDRVTDAAGDEWTITRTDDEELLIGFRPGPDGLGLTVIEAADLVCPVTVTREYQTIGV